LDFSEGKLSVRIILVRHGETDWNKERRIQGGLSDIPLNALGIKQAESLALGLGREKIQAVYSSPLKRSLETAKAIANRHQLEVVIEPALREIEAGKLEGITIAELGQNFSELLTRDAGDGSFPRAPGGESLPEVRKRSWEIVQRLAQGHPEGVLVLVSHYFVILTIVCSVLELPLTQISRLGVSTGSLSIINIDGQKTRLELLNGAANHHMCF
jgi:probable phosphoglycerate mutase